MTPEQTKALREPFPAEQIGKLPKAGTHLDYVGHAAVTDRLLQVDPGWTWEPFAIAEDGSPLVTRNAKNESVMWIRLTVCGLTRIGVGIVASGSFELEKQLISDALRNAAMRFGVALDLWSKEDLTPPPPLASQDVIGDLVERMNALPDEPRKLCKAKFRDQFGTPNHLLEADVFAATALVESFSVDAAITPAAPEIEGDAPAAPGASPSPKAVEKAARIAREVAEKTPKPRDITSAKEREQ